MNILIALILAIGWGAMPLITGKVGGPPVNQIFGIGAGASIIGLLAFLFTKPTVSPAAFAIALLCGRLAKLTSSFPLSVSASPTPFPFQPSSS